LKAYQVFIAISQKVGGKQITSIAVYFTGKLLLCVPTHLLQSCNHKTDLTGEMLAPVQKETHTNCG